jgi:hypothetical protein
VVVHECGISHTNCRLVILLQQRHTTRFWYMAKEKFK